MKFHEKGNLLLQLLILLLGTKQMIVTVTMEVDITAHQKFLHHQMIMVTLILKRKVDCTQASKQKIQRDFYVAIVVE
ncbi:hypothetical protein OUZ56_006146 [Daphnia magna]|uniref:Secreted protein n=1 Tax=Daphnia magna TaxID=35525 RepID=A0ABQ9YVE0_9CRUS|nr:hypothetical protein OUZ56_006146 [Daphnia magna]